MKPTLLFMLAMVILNTSFAAFTVAKPAEKTAPETREVTDKAMMELVIKMDAKDYEYFTGKKLNFFERIAFKLEKVRFYHHLKKVEGGRSGVNVGGFLLGLFFGPFAVLGAYLFSRDSNFIKWTWVGFGVLAFIILLILLLAIAVGKKH